MGVLRTGAGERAFGMWIEIIEPDDKSLKQKLAREIMLSLRCKFNMIENPMPYLTALTCAALALLLTVLSIHISRLRMRYKLSFGDGGHKDLQVAIRAHGNALEQSLLLGLLMLLMELLRPGWGALAAVGGVFVVARLLHAIAIFTRMLVLRQIAHVVSMLCQLILAVSLLWITLA
jgi:uncharacterized protein